MSDIAIQFDHVGKLYKLGLVGTGTLSHDLNRWWKTSVLGKEDPYLKIGETNDRSKKGSSDYVWALNDITFDVKQGDVVGIIGKNGAGKSTLLKLLSRVTSPTTGVIRAKGRIASLLEVGTGFHPELTGRENIYMNGSIMGMTHHEITRKLDEIVDFAGIERYVDTPVKRYSSGMTVRLGFAVAAFLEPEILVVDEVLAVGDAEFQKKAIGKMQDVSKGEGRTVLFVSHNMGAVKNLCTTGVLLENGQVAFSGSINDTIDRYLCNDVSLDDGKQIKDSIKYKKNFIEIDTISLNGTTANNSTVVPNQEFLDLEIAGTTAEAMKCEVKMIFKTISGVPMFSLVEGRYTGKLYDIAPGNFKIEKHIRLPKYMAVGDYSVDIILHQPLTQDFFQAYNAAQIHVDGGFDQFAHPIILADEGVCGLRSE